MAQAVTINSSGWTEVYDNSGGSDTVNVIVSPSFGGRHWFRRETSAPSDGLQGIIWGGNKGIFSIDVPAGSLLYMKCEPKPDGTVLSTSINFDAA